jgi:hypothetical protein
VAVCSGVRTEEHDLRAEATKAKKRVCNALIVNVSIEVDDEAVASHRIADRTGLQKAHVDTARGELLEHLKQTTRAIIGKFGDDARLIGTGGDRRGSTLLHKHKTSVSIRVIANVVCDDSDGGMRRNSWWRDRGIGQAILDDALRRVNVRVSRDVRMGGKILFQPATALSIGNGVSSNGRHRRQRNTGLRSQDKAHWDHVFANNTKLWGCGKCVLSGTNATLNAVFNSDHGEVAAARENIIEGFAHVVNSDPGLSLGSLDLT